MGFKSFCEQTEFVDQVLNEFNTVAPSSQLAPQKPKIWSAKKSEILQMWRNVKPDTPIILTPIAEKPEGSDKTNYGEDGVRVTGSFNFIMSVISRLKEIMTYENPETKLRLVFRGIDREKVRPDKQSYAFYINLERRGKGKRNKSKIAPNIVPQIQIP